MAIKSLEELKALRESMKTSLRLRHEGESSDTIEILVGMGTCGIASGARDTFSELVKVLEEKNVQAKVVSVGCIGYCVMEPTVELHIPGREALVYGKITKDKVLELVDTVIVNGGYLDKDLVIKSFEKAGM